MPTYYSRLTTVQLAVADLQDTTTVEPETRSRSAVSDEITSCVAKFAKASITGTLDETPILTEDAKRTHVRFLGEFSNMPFFMVRAGEAFFEPDVEIRRTRRPARVPPSTASPLSKPQGPISLQSSALKHGAKAGGANKPVSCEDDQGRIARQIRPQTTITSPIIPHALFLSVFLSEASFLPTHVKNQGKIIFHDVKIDVFFNGELCASSYVPACYHDDEHEMTQHIIRFSGRRVHRRLEKPWIIVPPGQGPDGCPRLREQNTGSSGDAKQRWTSVSEALMLEAGRLARGRNEEPSVLGGYLSALAALEMPAGLEIIQTVGGPKIGIIDVVVTAGKGHTDYANDANLMEPTPMRLEEPKKASTLAELDNVKDVKALRETSVHQHVVPTKERMPPQDINTTNALAQAQAGVEAQGHSLDLTLEKTFTTPTKKRRSISSHAETEILGQGFTSQSPRGLRSQSGIASDPVGGGNSTKPLSREQPQSKDPFTANIQNTGLFSTRTSPDNSVASSNKGPQLRYLQEKLQLGSENLSSDVKRALLVPSQIASSQSSDQRLERFSTPPGTSGRALGSGSAEPIPPAQKIYKGSATLAAPSKQTSPRKRRYNWHIVVDNKMTLEEEMESIANDAARATSEFMAQGSASRNAKQRAASNPLRPNERRPRLRETSDSKKEGEGRPKTESDNNGSKNPVLDAGKNSKVMNLQVRQPNPLLQPRKSLPLGPNPPAQPPRFGTPNFSPHLTPVPTLTPAPLSAHSSNHNSQRTTPDPNAAQRTEQFSPTSLLRTWPGTPPLSEDAVATYAPGNVLRQVKSERSGRFVEEGVVMGARFLLG